MNKLKRKKLLNKINKSLKNAKKDTVQVTVKTHDPTGSVTYTLYMER